jgi:hypothetical protein
MLIATTYQRPNAPIDLGDNVYHFRPMDPADSKSVHVADVHEDDVGTLLAIRNGDGSAAYYIPKAKGATTVSKPAASPAPAANAGGTPAGNAAGGNDADAADVQAAAKHLLDAHHKTRKAEIAKGGIPKAVLQAALEIEIGKPEEEQRDPVIIQLREAIEAAG